MIVLIYRFQSPLTVIELFSISLNIPARASPETIIDPPQREETTA
jgi:hypothetical protein